MSPRTSPWGGEQSVGWISSPLQGGSLVPQSLVHLKLLGTSSPQGAREALPTRTDIREAPIPAF